MGTKCRALDQPRRAPQKSHRHGAETAMKTPEEWIAQTRSGPGFSYALVNASEIAHIQADALEHAVLIAESYQQLVDAREAQAIRSVIYKIRAQAYKLKSK